ncbi:MAG: AAA-like domain-containing protein [Leptolyngbyaceae cyanobacterium MO_188.B28]|nr:AAA-like domain-containing protein [Leptolyngbyaceae cyanobacterium MO_188.B28]
MKAAEFKAILEELTPKQRKVLNAFLAGQADAEIAASLVIDPSTVRRHLANIGKAFALSNETGEHYSYRDDLINLFIRHQPEQVQINLRQGSLGRPLEPEYPGSPLTAESPFYILRSPIEERCIQEIRKPGALLRIRGPQCMGKTSLLQRLMAAARKMGLLAVRMNMRQAEPPCLDSLDTFLRWFGVHLSLKLNRAPSLDLYWDKDRFGSLVSCTIYVQTHLLENSQQGLLLALDDIDWLFEFPAIAQGFFALLRSWHEDAKNMEVWQAMRLAAAHSTEAYIPLPLHQSPFNVGLPIRLSALTRSQVETLTHRYGLDPATVDVDRLMTLVGGHPYLIQLALYHLHCQDISFATLLETAHTQGGVYSHHLRRCWQTLNTHPPLLSALQRVITAEPTATQLDPMLAYKLESMGLVYLQGDQVQLSCDLYRRYFRPIP